MALVSASEHKRYRRNQVVLEDGATTTKVYCVAEGLLRLVGTGARDHGPITTDFIRSGDFFMCESLMDDSYTTDAELVAALPSAVYEVPIPTLRKICLSYPMVALGLFEHAQKRATVLRGQIKRIASASSERLIGGILHELTELAPAGDGRYDKRITQGVIASYSGLSREQVNKTMRVLESRGLVRKDELGVQVPDEFGTTDFGDLNPGRPSLPPSAEPHSPPRGPAFDDEPDDR